MEAKDLRKENIIQINNRIGKSFRPFFILLENLQEGKNCGVYTPNPEKYKYDFEKATSFKLKLVQKDTCSLYFDAFLI